MSAITTRKRHKRAFTSCSSVFVQTQHDVRVFVRIRILIATQHRVTYRPRSPRCIRLVRSECAFACARDELSVVGKIAPRMYSGNHDAKNFALRPRTFPWTREARRRRWRRLFTSCVLLARDCVRDRPPHPHTAGNSLGLALTIISTVLSGIATAARGWQSTPGQRVPSRLGCHNLGKRPRFPRRGPVVVSKFRARWRGALYLRFACFRRGGRSI